jgi:uncharacterized Tic20 family protein
MRASGGVMNAATDSGLSRDARKWAMICHIIALVGLLGNGIGFLVGPLVVWLIKREDDPFIDEQGKEAVNFQLTMLLAVIVSIVLVVVVIGFFLLFVLAVMMTVFPIIAAIKANNGEHYRYPLSFKFIK